MGGNYLHGRGGAGGREEKITSKTEGVALKKYWNRRDSFFERPAQRDAM